jgi:hypothetical protein
MEFLILLALSGLLCVPAWYVAQRRKSWFEWDYATVFGPIPFWYALSIARIGPQSMGNLIELVVVAVFVPLAVSCRVFILDRLWKNPKRSSMIICAVCFILALGLRLAMPLLPE